MKPASALPFTEAERETERAFWRKREASAFALALARGRACPSGQSYEAQGDVERRQRDQRIMGEGNEA